MQAGAAAAGVHAAGVSPSAAVPPVPPPSRPDGGLDPGSLVSRRWRLVARIGRGAFGDIFVCAWEDDPGAPVDEESRQVAEEHRGRRFAIKIEKLQTPAPAPIEPGTDPAQAAAAAAEAAAAAASRAVLKLEAVILSKLQKYPFVGRFVEYGRDMELNVAYLVMSLLGENLLRLRRRRPAGKFSLPTVLRFGVQAIRAIQAVHDVGFLHRDIKPSNFVIGSNRNTLHASSTGCTSPHDARSTVEAALMSPSKIAIIDFGLARAYRDRSTGLVLPSRGHIKGFRGTPRYASVHVHREEDLSRRDDLWSLLYIMVEFCTGDLPWGHKRDKDEIGALKEKYLSLRLLKSGAPGDCPSCFVPFMQHLASLHFESKPNYAYLIELLQTKLRRMGFGSCEGDGLPGSQGEECPFDWEDCSTFSTMDGSMGTSSLVPLTPKQGPSAGEAEGKQRGKEGKATQAATTETVVTQPQQQQQQQQPPLQSTRSDSATGTDAWALMPQLPSSFTTTLPVATATLPASSSPPPPPLPATSPMAAIEAAFPSFTISLAPTRTAPVAAPILGTMPSSHPATTTAALSIPTPFGALPLASPLPIPDAVLLSPRKHTRGATMPASELNALVPPTAAMPAASSSSSSPSRASTTAAPSHPPRSRNSAPIQFHAVSTAAPLTGLHVSVSDSPGPLASPASALLAQVAAPTPRGLSSSSTSGDGGGLSPLPLAPRRDRDGLEAEDQRADMLKQRTMALAPGDESAASSRMPLATPSPTAGTSITVSAESVPSEWNGLPAPLAPLSSASASPSVAPALAAPKGRVVFPPLDPPPMIAEEPSIADGEGEGVRGDGRTLMPPHALENGDYPEPAHSLNDAYIGAEAPESSLMHAPLPGAGTHEEGELAGGSTMAWATDLAGSHSRASYSRSEMAQPSALPLPAGVARPAGGAFPFPSDSPHASPMRAVAGSLLLDVDSSSSATASASASPSPLHGAFVSATASPSLGCRRARRQLRMGSMEAEAPPVQQAGDASPTRHALAAHTHASSDRETHAGAPSARPTGELALAGTSGASAAPSAAAALSLSLPLRPCPPSQPPPSYTGRSFGRFRRAGAVVGLPLRSPAKPLPQGQVARVLQEADMHGATPAAQAQTTQGT